MTATKHDDQLGKMYPTMLMSLTVHLALVFHVFIDVAVMIYGPFLVHLADGRLLD